MSQTRPDRREEIAVVERPRTDLPRQYRVLLFNDDYTTMDFVVEVLETIFAKSPAEAMQIMLKVHKDGQGAAGVFSREVAETKVSRVHERAREAGFPLRAGIEEV